MFKKSKMVLLQEHFGKSLGTLFFRDLLAEEIN